ncbi:hypothetical protein GCM10020255_050620 [Rhodococcus baikonurensis]
MLSTQIRGELADHLDSAERDRAPISPLIADYPEIDVVDAYEIQLINIRRRVAGGAKVVGHKVGLSSLAMQQMMGVDEPDYGHLLAEMEEYENRPVDTSRFCFPRVEVEVAFILGADLPGAGCTEQDVIDATVAYAPSIELIDSRIKDWKIGLSDTIADNASSAGFILGKERVRPSDIDIKAIDAVLTCNGERIAEGAAMRFSGTRSPLSRGWLRRSTRSGFGSRPATSFCRVRARERSTLIQATTSEPSSAASAPSLFSSRRSSHDQGKCGDRRIGKHQHRSVVQTAALRVARAAMDDRNRSRVKDWHALARWDSRPPPRASTGCSARRRNRTWSSRRRRHTCTARQHPATRPPVSVPST